MNISEPPQIRLKIDSFRAIKSADIIIDGITVVTGENGCGKSTLSKLLYFFYKTVADYDLLVSQVATRELREIYYFLEMLLFDFNRLPKKKEGLENDTEKELYKAVRSFGRNTEDILSEEELSKIMLVLDKIEIRFKELSDLDGKDRVKKMSLSMQNRIKRIRREFQGLEEDIAESSPEISFQKIRDLIESKFKEAFGKMQSRPAHLFWNGLNRIFAENNKPSLEVYEYEEQLISQEKKNLSRSLDIDKVIYIDTPMAINIEGENDYWDDLNNLLKTKQLSLLFQENKHSNLSDLISNEIIRGEASFKDDVLSSEHY